MHKNIKLLILIIALLSIEGCVAPGSGFGKLKIQGSLVTATGQPIANKEIEFLLPAAYGLGGLDLTLNSPEDFGHKDQKFKTKTDKNGAFETDLGEHVYHISFWLLPPLGGFPRNPPAPFVFARISENKHEYYAIQTFDGKFKVFNYSGEELSLADSSMESIESTTKEGSHSEIRETIGIIKFKMKSTELLPNL